MMYIYNRNALRIILCVSLGVWPQRVQGSVNKMGGMGGGRRGGGGGGLGGLKAYQETRRVTGGCCL